MQIERITQCEIIFLINNACKSNLGYYKLDMINID
jgi:hypothetical protein